MHFSAMRSAFTLAVAQRSTNLCGWKLARRRAPVRRAAVRYHSGHGTHRTRQKAPARLSRCCATPSVQQSAPAVLGQNISQATYVGVFESSRGSGLVAIGAPRWRQMLQCRVIVAAGVAKVVLRQSAGRRPFCQSAEPVPRGGSLFRRNRQRRASGCKTLAAKQASRGRKRLKTAHTWFCASTRAASLLLRWRCAKNDLFRTAADADQA